MKTNKTSVNDKLAWMIMSCGSADGIMTKHLPEWHLYFEDHLGTFFWTKRGYPNIVYATPFWEDCNGIDVAVVDANGVTIFQDIFECGKDITVEAYFKLLADNWKKIIGE